MKTDLLRLSVIGLLLLASCSDNAPVSDYAPPKKDSIDISEVAVVLPDANGKDKVEISCVPCHSLRYIEMQPNMNKKGWEKIVTKMIKTYGAPVKDSIAANEIVEYLVAIKGKK